MAHVLIVDDERFVRILMRETLASDPTLRFSEAENGAQALAQLSRDTPDLIILDIMMPHMDGIQTYQAIRAHPLLQSMPILFVSAKEQADVKLADLASADSVHYLQKPFELADLEVIVQHLLHAAPAT